MSLTREERKLLHQKSQQPTFGSGKPNNDDGFNGDISYRKVEGSGTVQYLKENNSWTAISSSGEMPPIRIAGGGGGSGGSSSSSGVTSHNDLTSLSTDDHVQYLLIDGTRAMTSVVTIGADSDGTDRSITWGHSTLKTIMGIDDSSDAFVINTDAAFDATLANNSFSIDANHNVIIAGDVSVGDDLFLTSSGSIINWNSGDVTLTHAAGKLTFDGDGAVELDFNNHEMTNVDIDSGAIDGTTIGAASQAAGDFTAIGAVAAGTIVGTTIDATTDFTIGTTVITDDSIVMTPTSGDTFTLVSTTNGATSLTTVDTAGAAAHLTVVVDGNVDIDGLVVTLDAVTSIELEGATNITGALTTTSTAIVGTDLTITGGDIIYGNGQNATASVTPTAHNVAGRLLTISAGNTTAGTTNNIAGGSLKFSAGQGKGSGAGGSIVFATANAGSSGSTLNAAATALTISDDLSSTFQGEVYIHDGSNNIFYFDPALVRFYMYDDAAVANYMYLQVLANGVTKLKTIDGGGTAADFYIDADGDIYLDAIGEGIYFEDNGVTRMLFNLDATPEIDITGDFTIDGSADITLDAAGAFLINGGSTITATSITDFIVNTRGAQRMFVDDDGSIFLHNYAQDLNNNNYGINNKKDLYHFTTGNGDFMQNYTIISEYEVLSAGEFEAYPS